MSYSSEEEVSEQNVLEKEISQLRSTKKELFERSRPVNEELERIAQRERERVDKLHRIIVQKHDGEKQEQTVQRVIELEAELRSVKCENDKLKREKAECSEMNSKLRKSLDQATRNSTAQRQKITELTEQLSVEEGQRSGNIQAYSETVRLEFELEEAKWENTRLSETINKLELSLEQAAKKYETQLQELKTLQLASRVTVATKDSYDNSTVGELQKQLHETRKLLNKTREELSGTRQRLSDVQERLTVAEQVTAATQQRELQESGNSQRLQLELTPQHHSTTHTGTLVISQ